MIVELEKVSRSILDSGCWVVTGWSIESRELHTLRRVIFCFSFCYFGFFFPPDYRVCVESGKKKTEIYRTYFLEGFVGQQRGWVLPVGSEGYWVVFFSRETIRSELNYESIIIENLQRAVWGHSTVDRRTD